jgi:hypothetical protein
MVPAPEKQGFKINLERSFDPAVLLIRPCYALGEPVSSVARPSDPTKSIGSSAFPLSETHN